MVMVDKTKSTDGRTDSPSWAFNCVRTDAFVALITDLKSAEETGLAEKQTELVRSVLKRAIDCAAAASDQAFDSRPLRHDLETFAQQFEIWNAIPEAGPQSIAKRREGIKKLQRARRSVAERVRGNEAVLDKALKLEPSKNVFEALSELNQADPKRFRSVGRAVTRFQKHWIRPTR